MSSSDEKETIRLINKIERREILLRIKKLKTKGGFPNQYTDETKTASWTTSDVLLLHRKYNFLSNDDVSEIITYLLKSYCISIEKKYWLFGKNKREYYGWGSFSDTVNKQPIPIITSFVLLSLCGYQCLDSRLSKFFELATIWLLNQQKNIDQLCDDDYEHTIGGFWDEKEDFYSNMYIIICLVELKKVYKNTNPTLHDAIQNKLANSKNFYASLTTEDIQPNEIVFFKIICSLLKISIDIHIPFPETLSIKFDFKSTTSTLYDENFSYEKPSVIYYLYIAALDRTFYKNYKTEINNLLRLIEDEQEKMGFWTKRNQNCLWLTCDILILLRLFEESLSSEKNCFYREMCNTHFKLPLSISLLHYIKVAWRIKSRLSKAYKLYSIFS